MPLKENKLKTYLLVGGLIYLLLFYFSLHMGHAVYLDEAATKAAEISSSIQFGTYGNAASAPVVKESINWFTVAFEALANMSENPVAIWPLSIKFLIPALFFLVCVAFGIGWMLAIGDTKRQDAPGKEHGSAKWNLDYANYYKQFVEPYDSRKDPFDPNMPFSNRVMLNLNNKKTGRNANVFVVGGPGTGKSFRVIKPSLMQMNCSMITTDPSGELMQCCGKPLHEHGIKLKLFSTSDMKHSNCYNPFDYIFDENGEVEESKVSTMINLFLENASGSSSKSKGDPFWDKSARALMAALAYYMLENPMTNQVRKGKRYAPDINFCTMLKLVQAGKVSEESETSQSALDKLMEEHRLLMKTEGRESKALSNYDTFKLAPGKTANSILITVAVDLQMFNNEDVRNLTRHDYEDEENNLQLDKIGDEQTALFINIPQANTTFNFLVSMLYAQMFDALYTKAEKICPKKWMLIDQYNRPVITMLNSEDEAKRLLEDLKTATVKEYKTPRDASRFQIVIGNKVIQEKPTRETAQAVIDNAANYKVQKGDLRLPWHIRCLMDEFANIGSVPMFSEKLTTMRKYEISCTIVVQNIAQIKEKYDKLFESIIGGCDTIVFLGSSENETCKYISDTLGETTVRTRNISLSHGQKGGSSEGFGTSKRMLLTPEEVKNLDNKECIVIIRGLHPFRDLKYDFSKHPHFAETGNASRNNELSEEFIEKYFNTKPVKKKKVTKKRQQKAVALVAGKSEYANDLEGANQIMQDNRVTKENIEERMEAQISTKTNTENKKDAMDERESIKKALKEDTGTSMSDSTFMF
jgi:type IV secretory pathway TraG/TraD family ATPase VirD4